MISPRRSSCRSSGMCASVSGPVAWRQLPGSHRQGRLSGSGPACSAKACRSMAIGPMTPASTSAAPPMTRLKRRNCRVRAAWAGTASTRAAPASRSSAKWRAEHYRLLREPATSFMDAVCTSGVATGHAADLGKIDTFRRGMGDHALTLASGITPENATHYMR